MYMMNVNECIQEQALPIKKCTGQAVRLSPSWKGGGELIAMGLFLAVSRSVLKVFSRQWIVFRLNPLLE